MTPIVIALLACAAGVAVFTTLYCTLKERQTAQDEAQADAPPKAEQDEAEQARCEVRRVGNRYKPASVASSTASGKAPRRPRVSRGDDGHATSYHHPSDSDANFSPEIVVNMAPTPAGQRSSTPLASMLPSFAEAAPLEPGELGEEMASRHHFHPVAARRTRAYVEQSAELALQISGRHAHRGDGKEAASKGREQGTRPDGCVQAMVPHGGSIPAFHVYQAPEYGYVATPQGLIPSAYVSAWPGCMPVHCAVPMNHWVPGPYGSVDLSSLGSHASAWTAPSASYGTSNKLVPGKKGAAVVRR